MKNPRYFFGSYGDFTLKIVEKHISLFFNFI